MQWYFRIRAAPQARMSSRVLQILETQLVQIGEFRFSSCADVLHLSFTISSLESKAIRIGHLLRRSAHIFSVVWINYLEPRGLDVLEQLAISLWAPDEEQLLKTDPNSSFWRSAPSIRMNCNSYGEVTQEHETEVRLRWTKDNLYFLFRCDYKELNLRTDRPRIDQPVDELWKWDVAEVFIAAAPKALSSYCEFEVSPQGEWINLLITCTEDGLSKTPLISDSKCEGSIDEIKKQWYAFLKIPHHILGSKRLKLGARLKINLFRSQGQQPVELAWRPTYAETFHIPASFGDLLLTD